MAWFGEIERKLAKLSMTTFTCRSSSQLFYGYLTIDHQHRYPAHRRGRPGTPGLDPGDPRGRCRQLDQGDVIKYINGKCRKM